MRQSALVRLVLRSLARLRKSRIHSLFLIKNIFIVLVSNGCSKVLRSSSEKRQPRRARFFGVGFVKIGRRYTVLRSPKVVKVSLRKHSFFTC
jgi:hypothetical protein